MDSCTGDRLLCGLGWHQCAGAASVGPPRDYSSGSLVAAHRPATDLLRPTVPAVHRPLWHLHCAELFPLVPLLGTGSGAGLFPDQALWKGRGTAQCGTQLFPVHRPGQRGDAARLPVFIPANRHVRLHRTRQKGRQRQSSYFLRRPRRAVGEGAARATAHLAGASVRRRADTGDHAAHRRDVENGRVRFPAAHSPHLP